MCVKLEPAPYAKAIAVQSAVCAVACGWSSAKDHLWLLQSYDTTPNPHWSLEPSDQGVSDGQQPQKLGQQIWKPRCQMHLEVPLQQMLMFCNRAEWRHEISAHWLEKSSCRIPRQCLPASVPGEYTGGPLDVCRIRCLSFRPTF